MTGSSFLEFQQQCSKSDMAFFELLKSISELHACENTLSDSDIEQLEVGARVLNRLISRRSKVSSQLAR